MTTVCLSPPHAMCHFESALRVTCGMTLMLRVFFSPSLPGVNGRLCQDSWPCFLLRMWEGSDLCCTQNGCRTPIALVPLNRFTFLSSEKPDDRLSLFSNLCFLKLWSASERRNLLQCNTHGRNNSLTAVVLISPVNRNQLSVTAVNALVWLHP